MKHVEFYVRNETLYYGVYEGTNVITRKSMKTKIKNEHWDNKKKRPNHKCHNKELIEKMMRDTTKRIELEYNGCDFRDENQDFLLFAEKRIRENQAIREVSKSKYHNYISNFRWAVKEELKKETLSVSDLRNPDNIKRLKMGLRKNRKKKGKLKSDTAYVDAVKALAREINEWNIQSETPYPINTTVLKSDLPKKASKPAVVLSDEQFNRFCDIQTESRSQKLAQRVYMFQYLGGGLRIFDILLLTNKSFLQEYIQIQVMKTRTSIRIPYSLDLLNCLDIIYPSELNEAYEKFRFNNIKMPGTLFQDVLPIIRNWALDDLTYPDFMNQFNRVVTDKSTPKSKVESMFEVLELVENDIIKRFVDSINVESERFVFPLLNYPDFKDTLYDTTKLSKRQNQLAHNGRQKHIEALKRFCSNHNFPKLSGHSPRHSFAAKLDNEGYTVEDIKDVMAHTSPKTTMIYLRNRHPKSTALKTLREVNRNTRRRRLMCYLRAS